MKKKKGDKKEKGPDRMNFPIWIAFAVIGVLGVVLCLFWGRCIWLSLGVLIIGFPVILLIDKHRSDDSEYEKRIPVLLGVFGTLVAGFIGAGLLFNNQPEEPMEERNGMAEITDRLHEGDQVGVMSASVSQLFDEPLSETKEEGDSTTRILGVLFDKSKAINDSSAQIDIYREIVTYVPTSAESSFYVGMAYYNLKEYEHAIDCLQRGFEFDDIEDYTLWLNLYLSLSNLFLGRREEAIHYCDSAMESKGSQNILYAIYSLKADCMEDDERKRSFNEKVLSIPPTRASEYYVRGNVFSDLEKKDSAILNYTKAITMDPTNYEYYHFRGRCFYYYNDPQRAYDDMKQAVSINPSDSDCFFLMGLSCIALSKYLEAESCFTRALQIAPESRWALFMRALSRLLSADSASIEEALHDYDSLLDKHEDITDLYYFRSIAKRESGSFDFTEDARVWENSMQNALLTDSTNYPEWWTYCSEEVMRRVIDLYKPFVIEDGLGVSELSRSGMAYHYLGEDRRAKKRYSKAIKFCAFNRIFALSDKYRKEAACLYYNRSVVESNLFLSLRKAIRDASKAIELNPESPTFFFWRSRLYFRKNKLQRQKEDLNRAIQLDPTKKVYYRNLGFSYKFSGDDKSALSCFKKALQIDSLDSEIRKEVDLLEMLFEIGVLE